MLILISHFFWNLVISEPELAAVFLLLQMTKTKKNEISDKIDWIGAPLRSSDEGNTHYGGVRISHASKPNEVHSILVGHVAFLKSPDAIPYIAMIDDLYENKGGDQLCKSTWFYR